jgi:cytochrome c2
MRTILQACFGMLVVAMPAQADPASDKTGRDLATSYCGACHRVSSEQEPKPKFIVDTEVGLQEFSVPSFRQIALRPGRDADYLRTFIQAPHYPMREQLFIPKELDQIVSYILSLKAADAGHW